MNKIVLIIAVLVKKPIDADCSTWAGKVETNPKAPKLKVGDRGRITMHKNVFKKG